MSLEMSPTTNPFDGVDLQDMLSRMKCCVPGCRKISPMSYCPQYHVLCDNHYHKKESCLACAGPMTRVKFFLMELKDRKFKFDIFRLFCLEFDTFLSMMGIVSTYIVILIQFKTSTSSVTDENKK